MALSKFLDPKNDASFKRIFGTEKNKDILIHFLNDILGFTGLDEVQEVEFLSPIQDPEIAAKKQSIVDILCKDSRGIRFIVEMQFTKTKGFEKRAQYYAAKAYSGQADVGNQYHDLREIIFIAIADCVIFPDKSEYKSDHIILDKNNYEHDLKDFYFTFIELPKFPKIKEDQLENIIEKWCYFFRYAAETKEEDLDKIVGSDVIIKRAYDELNQFNWSEQELMAYDQGKKRLMDELAALAEKFDEGIKVGEQRGREEGRKEREIEVVKNLLKAGIPIDVISESTGLSVYEIKQLDSQK
ncbi:MAG: Rpn family recombination-promoting nuclease/putative transposase [Wolbachia endosymbiont of Tyrophagus putrescentiae]|nr:Rpn family recombination-promoting nuclease/putative transposase [Wolbachia endosymbiont of Tyrophagus putrescentiae]